MRKVSFALERRIKRDMPVDTGRARASWGHWTPGDLSPRAKGASSTDAVWQQSPSDLKTEQGSNVEYIGKLNAGHSQQAIAGFIDAGVEHAQKELENEVDAAIARYV